MREKNQRNNSRELSKETLGKQKKDNLQKNMIDVEEPEPNKKKSFYDICKSKFAREDSKREKSKEKGQMVRVVFFFFFFRTTVV